MDNPDIDNSISYGCDHSIKRKMILAANCASLTKSDAHTVSSIYFTNM